MCLVFSSKSSDLEKRVLGKRISGGIDGSELREDRNEVDIFFCSSAEVAMTHPPSPWKIPSRGKWCEGSWTSL